VPATGRGGRTCPLVWAAARGAKEAWEAAWGVQACVGTCAAPDAPGSAVVLGFDCQARDTVHMLLD